MKKPDASLPSDISAEVSLLGGVFLENEAFFEAEDLTVDDFSLESHRRIFRLIAEIMTGMVPDVFHVDIVTMSAELTRRKEIDSVGGVSYLSSLTEGLPRRPSIIEYAHIVREKAKQRRLMIIGRQLASRAEDQFTHSGELQEWVQTQLNALSAEEKIEASAVGELTRDIERNILSRRAITSDDLALDLTWGIEKLDRFTKGAFGGEFTVCAGDSGGMKTAFMLQMVLENALKGVPCSVFSLEMERRKLTRRLYPLMSEVLTTSHMRDPRTMNLEHVAEMKRISAEIARLPIWIDDESPMTFLKFQARTKMMRRRHKVRLIAADYLQLMTYPGKIGAEETKAVVFGMRDLVKTEPDLHLLTLSQYSKEQGFVRKRRRVKGDLYGGAAIHQAAQNVLLITVESPEKRDKDDLLDAEIMVEKQREGAVGKVVLSVDRSRLRFLSNTGETRNGDSRGVPDSGRESGKDRAGGSGEA